jgi:ABC-type sugar transport system ATPase subunit
MAPQPTTAKNADALLEFGDVHKSFGAVHALRGVSFGVRAGEVHAVVGENGAGKSTLLKILAGVQRPGRGRVLWNGHALRFASPRDALSAGIGTVYQDRLFFPNLSVTANIFAGHEQANGWGQLDERAMEARAAALLEQLHVPLSPGVLMSQVSPAHVQLVQVARALAFNCKVLVLDEPTDALTDGETQHLFRVIAGLKERGTTILFVSHRLPEVFSLSDRITVLRDGQHIVTMDRPDATVDDVVRAMVGREPPERIALPSARTGERPLLSVRKLKRLPRVRSISLDVFAGEIVGLFGLAGSGRTELLETIFGIAPPDAGEIVIDAAPLEPGSVRASVAAGVALVPEDRQRQGLFSNLTVEQNLALPAAEAQRRLRIRPIEEARLASESVSALSIKTPGLQAPPNRLSGGNQQKIVVGKWLGIGPRVLLLDEPTKGVDIGAKYELHNIVRREAARGMGCVLASSDLPEVLALATRIVVLRDGHIQGELPSDSADEEQVMRLAASRSEAIA